MLSEMLSSARRRKSTGSSPHNKRTNRLMSLPLLPALDMTPTNSTPSRKLSISTVSSGISPSSAAGFQPNWAVPPEEANAATNLSSDESSSDGGLKREFQRRRSLIFSVRTKISPCRLQGSVTLEAVLKEDNEAVGVLLGKVATTPGDTHEIKQLEVDKALRRRGIGQELCGCFLSTSHPDPVMVYFDPGDRDQTADPPPEIVLAAGSTYLKSALKAGYNFLSVYDATCEWRTAEPYGSYEFYLAEKCVSLVKQHAHSWRRMRMVFQVKLRVEA